jgi:cysteine desulfurase family protein
MKTRIIYFDNAATTCPKPETVYSAQDRYARKAANPGRGAHRLALESARVLFETRNAAAGLLGIKQPERLIFTPGCTYSINMALKGLPWQAGDVVLTSALEHNAVMRSLRQLMVQEGVQVVTIPYAKKGVLDMHKFISAMLELHPRLCVFSEASNVTGEAIDLQAVAAICGAHKVALMIDAAQTAGRSLRPLDPAVSIWCASGHKGLYGMPGVGLLYVAPGIDLEPLVTGGTGSQSESLEMPDSYPDHLEPGTLPGPAIAALGAGIQWLSETGVAKVVQGEDLLTKRFLAWAQHSQRVTIYGNRYEGSGIPVVSFAVPGVACDVVAAQLDNHYGIAVRTGLHCAAAAHQTLGTSQTGLVRASFSYFNSADEVDALCNALESIAAQRDIQAPV